MKKRLGLLFGLGLLLTLIVAPIILHLAFPVIKRDTSTADFTDSPNLSENNHTINYQPGKTHGKFYGVPMRFDQLDLSSYHAIRYFVENGYSGLSHNKTNVVNADWLHLGFPPLYLQMASLPISAERFCDGEGLTLAERCPVGEIGIKSNGYQSHQLLKALRGEEAFDDQSNVMPKHRSITQWSAFFTQKASSTTNSSEVNDTWLGWQCDKTRLDAQNKALSTWGSKVNLWGQNPIFHADNCYPLDDKTQAFLLKHFPDRAAITEHPIIWECPPKSSEYHQCTAHFIYQKRLVTLTIPGKGIAGTDTDNLGKKRHLIVQGVWQWLQNAAQRAETSTDINVGEALKKDFAVCEQLDTAAKPMLALGGDKATAVRQWWSKSNNAVTSIYPRSPCAKVLHRLLQVEQSLHKDTNLTPTLANIPSENDRLEMLKKLIEIETRYSQDQPEPPLKALHDTYLARVHGENSPEVFTATMTKAYLFAQPEAALKRYQAFGENINQLSAQQRMTLRRELAYRLWDRKYQQHNAVRRELMWAAARELSIAPDALDDIEHIDTLKMAMIFTLNRDITPDENVPSVADLTLRLAALAKSIAADKKRTDDSKISLIALSGVYAAWQANLLAVEAHQNGKPHVAKRWQTWVSDWYTWVLTTLKIDENAYDNPHWVDAIKTHVEAAKDYRLTEPNCAGGQYNDCRLGLYP